MGQGREWRYAHADSTSQSMDTMADSVASLHAAAILRTARAPTAMRQVVMSAAFQDRRSVLSAAGAAACTECGLKDPAAGLQGTASLDDPDAPRGINCSGGVLRGVVPGYWAARDLAAADTLASEARVWRCEPAPSLPYISPISHPYLPYISPMSRLHLACISPGARPRLPSPSWRRTRPHPTRAAWAASTAHAARGTRGCSARDASTDTSEARTARAGLG